MSLNTLGKWTAERSVTQLVEQLVRGGVGGKLVSLVLMLMLFREAPVPLESTKAVFSGRQEMTQATLTVCHLGHILSLNYELANKS